MDFNSISKNIYQFIEKVQQMWHDGLNFIVSFSFVRSLKLNHPASLFIVLWPCLWGVFSAADISVVNIVLLALLAVVLRAACCLYNDMSDDKIEVINNPAEQPNLYLLALLVVTSLFLAFEISPLTLITTIAWMALVAAYPYMFKITWWPQLYAGVIFGAFPILIGQTSSEAMSFNALPAMVAGFFWATGVETMRAKIKEHHDLEQGLKSVTLILGEKSIMFISGCFVLTMLFLVLSGMAEGASGLYYAFLMIAQAVLSKNWHKASIEETGAIMQTWQSSTLIGLIITIGFVFS